MEEAFAQLAVEENRTDSGPDLVKAPYLSAFFFASKLEKDAPSLDFEAYALNTHGAMEQKEDINAWPLQQLSLCQNRIKEFEADASEHVIEIGTARLKKLVIAHVDAFVRCSNKTIESLASVKSSCNQASSERLRSRLRKKKRKKTPRRRVTPRRAPRLCNRRQSKHHRSTTAKSSSSRQRRSISPPSRNPRNANEFIAERRARLTALTENPSPGDLDAPDVPAAAKIHAELRETEIVVERLKKAHANSWKRRSSPKVKRPIRNS